jgi:hypothetical protein
LIVFNECNNVPNIVLNGDYELVPQQCVKLLGVQVDTHITFTEHVNSLCKKAGWQLNALARLSKDLDIEAKLILFQTFIVCHFNYCPIVWHFCNTTSMRKIEKIQYRALKYVYNDFVSSYSTLRDKCNRPLLYTQRIRSLMIEGYKCINKYNCVYFHDLVRLKTNDLYCMRNVKPLEQPTVNTVKYGLNSYRYQCAKFCGIDNNIKCALTLKEFTCLINKWNGPTCNCSFCSVCVINNM